MTPRTATLADGQEVAYWTIDAVWERLQEAARTLRCMPARGCFPAGFAAAWPEVVRGFWEVWNALEGADDRTRFARDRNAVRPRPTAAAIDAMDEAITWLRWVADRRKVRLLWALATGVKPGRAAEEMGVHRSTAATWKREALEDIVRRLNG